MSIFIKLAECGFFCDSIIRWGIRKLLAARLVAITNDSIADKEWIARLESGSLAVQTEAANSQHYEIPASYFSSVLGIHVKYSSGFWPDTGTSLNESEAIMLQLTCERAELKDGQRILELGCGWGSLSLWMASHYPKSTVVAISNSHSQRAYIESKAQERGLNNLRVVTCDINNYYPEGNFDRVVSIEMFEHVRNHRQLLNLINDWLVPGGKLFTHIFSHCKYTYLFDVKSDSDWMSRYFFTGGIMPSAELLNIASGSLNEEARWTVNGKHYSRTLEAWLKKHDAEIASVDKAFIDCYGKKEAKVWGQRWRIFYMACSELFAYNNGEEWPVMHYLFVKPIIELSNEN